MRSGFFLYERASGLACNGALVSGNQDSPKSVPARLLRGPQHTLTAARGSRQTATGNKDLAVRIARSAAPESALPLVLEVAVGAGDGGAESSSFSQFPKGREWAWGPHPRPQGGDAHSDGIC